MSTSYVGYRPILTPASWSANTYTGKKGIYSNWYLFSTTHAFDGAPDYNVQPGQGPFPGDYQLSRWFLGLDPAGSRLADAGNLYPNVYQGHFGTWLFQGVASGNVWNKTTKGLLGPENASGYGHVFTWGGTSAATAESGYAAAYGSLGYFYYGLSNNAPSQALKNSAHIGHVERYPQLSASTIVTGTKDQPFSFGAFEPLLYKGTITEKSDPLSSTVVNLGHIEYPVRTDILHQTDHYGFEHVMEWRGVPSAKAL